MTPRLTSTSEPVWLASATRICAAELPAHRALPRRHEQVHGERAEHHGERDRVDRRRRRPFARALRALARSGTRRTPASRRWPPRRTSRTSRGRTGGPRRPAGSAMPIPISPITLLVPSNSEWKPSACMAAEPTGDAPDELREGDAEVEAEDDPQHPPDRADAPSPVVRPSSRRVPHCRLPACSHCDDTPRGYHSSDRTRIPHTVADGGTHEPTSSPSIASPRTERKRILNRLRRLEGQVRGLQTMIESGQGVRRRAHAGHGGQVGAQPSRPAHHRTRDEELPDRRRERHARRSHRRGDRGLPQVLVLREVAPAAADLKRPPQAPGPNAPSRTARSGYGQTEIPL